MKSMGRDAEHIRLNELQTLIRGPVVAIIRRHSRGQPITFDQIRDKIDTWLAIYYPDQYEDGKVKRRDIEKVVQYCRTARTRADREPICSNGDGLFFADSIEDYDSYISQLENRLRAIGINLKFARMHRRDIALRKYTSAPIETDIFDQQIEDLPEQSGSATVTSLPNRRRGENSLGGGKDNDSLPGRERIDQ